MARFESLTTYLDGTFENGIEPSSLYICSLHGHPEFVKLGFCSIKFRNLRHSDPLYKDVLFESCKDDEIAQKIGDIKRTDAWLYEQFILEKKTARREIIPELKDKKWSGYTETLHLPEEDREKFIQEFKTGILYSFRRDLIGLENWYKLIKELCMTDEDRNLFKSFWLDINYDIQPDEEVKKKIIDVWKKGGIK